MSTLKSRLDSLASSFAQEVVRAIQSASLEELLGEVRGTSPGPPASGQSSPANVAPRQGRRKAGRLPRRSAEDIKASLEKVHSLLKSNGGLRSEQIRAALKLDVRELPRILKKGLASKKLTSKGQKRATTYFAR